MTLSGKAPRSRLDAEPVARRDWLGWAGLGTMGGALLFGLVGLLRLPKAAVLASPAKKYKIALPEALAPGTPFLPPGRGVAIFKDAQGVYAISTTCTHLGCVIKPTEEGFECPCHGSRFHANGEVAKGPAPRALPWFKVTVSGGAVQVDEGATVEAGTKVAV